MNKQFDLNKSKDKTPFNITITNPTDKPTTSVIFGFDNTNPQDKRPSLIERIEWKSETKGQLEQKVFVCDSEDNKKQIHPTFMLSGNFKLDGLIEVDFSDNPIDMKDKHFAFQMLPNSSVMVNIYVAD